MPQLDGFFAFATIALWAYCLFDVIRTPDGTTENLPKMIWLLIVIFIPLFGSLAWLLLGRPRHASFNLRTTSFRTPEPPPAPTLPQPPVRNDDFQRKREEALRRYQEQREVELKRREEELRKREEELRKRYENE